MCQRGVFRTKLILAAEIPLIWRSKVFSNAERKPTPDADREGSNFLSDEKHALSLSFYPILEVSKMGRMLVDVFSVLSFC